MTFIRNLDGIKDRLIKLSNGYKVKLFSKDGEAKIYIRGKTKDLGYLSMVVENHDVGRIWRVVDIEAKNKLEILLWDVALEWVNALDDLGIEVERKMMDEEYYYLEGGEDVYYLRRGDVYYSDKVKLHCYKVDNLVSERLKSLGLLEIN